MKRCLSILVLFLVLAFSPGYLFAQDFPPALVITEPVQMLDFHQQLTLIGRSEARAESRIVAEVSGPVMKINALEGVWISKSRPLVTIDPQRIKLSLRAKEAEAAQAKAEAVLAEKEFARVDDLFRQEILSERSLDQAAAEVERSLERHKQLEVERDQLVLDIEKCTIRAPYGGYTIRQLVQIGEWVSPGTPVYEIVDLSVIKVTVDLPERHFGQVDMGSPVPIFVSSGGDSSIVGKVTGIAPQASETTHTFPLIVSVPNPEGRLGSGMLVKATVSLKGKFTSLAVSKDAIIRQGDRTLVYTIVEGKAAPINVITSSSNGTMVAVQGEGLADGMPVVVRGNERIFPGSPVQTPDAGQKESEEKSEEAATTEASG
jgi:RND family efflux transporter MFP subunit